MVCINHVSRTGRRLAVRNGCMATGSILGYVVKRSALVGIVLVKLVIVVAKYTYTKYVYV